MSLGLTDKGIDALEFEGITCSAKTVNSMINDEMQHAGDIVKLINEVQTVEMAKLKNIPHIYLGQSDAPENFIVNSKF